MLPPEAENVLGAAVRARRKLRGRARILAVLALGLIAWLALDAAILLGWITDLAAARKAWSKGVSFVCLAVLVAALSARFPKEPRERAAR